VIVLRILGVLLALFVAYVVGRAIGILLGIGPYRPRPPPSRSRSP